ncbi:MAG TPA: SpoIIE family protein phosphatase [candidate division Zixibacteria bacterium]|nr:SpoIIE family protein phosphatase [candidate division Zixibacteria bacterium]
MIRRPVKEINAEFSAEEKYLDSIQRTVREACVAANMSRKEISAVLLATEEAATNIIRHAYLYEKGVLRLRIVIYRKFVVFSFIDFGRSFQPNSTGKIDLEKLVESGRKGGLGFYMMQKIMDSVEYISSASRNELRMIKRLGETKADTRPLIRRMWSLRMKFSIWTFFIVSVIIGGAFYYIDRQTSDQILDRLDNTVQSLVKTVADQAAGYFIRSRSDVEFDELVVSYVRANPELDLLVLTDTLGIVRAHSDDARNIRKPFVLPPGLDTTEAGPGPIRFEEDGRELNYLSWPILSGRRQFGEAHVVYSSEEVLRQRSEARWRTSLVTVLLLAVGVLGIYVLSNYFVRPIVRITQRVRRFASGDLESELPLGGAEEFFEISRALNEMMTRLSQDRKNIVAREKLAKEIEVASQIQQTLLPHELPDIFGLELDAFYRAASVVGGDLYDVFEIDPGRYCLVVADVSGKGVPASLVMSMLRTVIQIHAARAESARNILIRVDSYLKKNMPGGMFITVMLAVYDSAERSLSLVSAGHNPMLYFAAEDHEVRPINPSGMPLGMPVTLEGGFGDSLEERRMELHNGDLFFIFTDGITEAADREGRQFGMDRLAKFLRQWLVANGSEGVHTLSEALVAELDDFTGFAGPADDISFIIARAVVTGEADQTEGPATISSAPDDPEI